MTSQLPLSTKQVSEELNVDRSLVTRMVQAGKLKPLVRGDGIRGALFFAPAEVRRVKERMSATTGDAA